MAETNESWHDPRIVPFADFQLSPAAVVFHYAQEIFEGLKAYRHADGSIRTFRPMQNAERFANSARRLAMAELPDEAFNSLFDPLRRGSHNASQGEHASLGLGLFLVREICHAHRGTVRGRWRDGRTSFVITLPKNAD